MTELTQQITEILRNVNWMLEAHESVAELIAVHGRKVIIRCRGYCSECGTNCVEAAFRERLPNIELLLQ